MGLKKTHTQFRSIVKARYAWEKHINTTLRTATYRKVLDFKKIVTQCKQTTQTRHDTSHMGLFQCQAAVSVFLFFLFFPLGYPRRHGNAPILSLLFPPQDFRLLFVFRFKFSVSSLHKKGFNHRRIKNTIMHISESCINILRGRREKQNIAAQKVEGEREERKNQQPKKTNQRI